MADQIKLLVLEDNEIFRESFLALSKKYFFEVVGLCKNSQDLLQQIKEKNPQVILLDLIIPEEDVLELIEQIKSLYPHIPLIACSSLKEKHIVTKILKAGCFDYIFKPFKEEDLVQSIKNAVA